MKLGFIVPALNNVDLDKIYADIKEVCDQSEVDFEIIFAMNSKSEGSFTNVRRIFVENNDVRAIKLDMEVSQHELITIAMKHCEKYSAAVIYAAKEDINKELLTKMINSWKAGNKIVFVKKHEQGFKEFLRKIKESIYNIGLKILKVFEDRNAETDIQLFDQEVVATINQLPAKNRQLRVLDSFIGYSNDVISVPKNQPDNAEYLIKPKGYMLNFFISGGLLLTGLTTLLIAILALALRWDVTFSAHVVFWCSAFVMLVLSFIYQIKTQLLFRVGRVCDPNDIKTMFEKAEKYNLKNTD